MDLRIYVASVGTVTEFLEAKTEMEKFRKYAVVPFLLLILSAAGCANLSIPVPGAGPDPYDGLDLAARDALTLREANKIRVQNAELESYLFGVLEALYGKEALVEKNIRVALIASESPGASVLPDGLVLWHVGTFDYLKNEDEVAAILAHEMAHLKSKHHETNMTGALMDKIMAAGETAVIYSGAGSMAELWTAANSVRWASDSLLFPSFTREQETEADVDAAKTLVAAGYNADAVRTMLSKLRVFYGDKAEFVAEKMFALSTEESGTDTTLKLNVDTDAIVSNVKGFAEAQWGQAYETFTERETAVRTALQEDHPERERGKFRTKRYEALLASDAVATWLNDHRIGFELVRLVIEGKEGVAEFHKAADYLMKSSVTSDAFDYDSIFKSALKNEQVEVAANIAARMIESQDATLEHYLIYGSYERQQGNPERALAAFQIADDTFSSRQDQTIVPMILSAKDQAGIKQGRTAFRCLDPSLTMACLKRQEQ